MIQAKMVGNKIQNEFQAVLMQDLPDHLETGLPTQSRRNFVGANRIGRSSNIGFGPIGKNLLVGSA